MVLPPLRLSGGWNDECRARGNEYRSHFSVEHVELPNGKELVRNAPLTGASNMQAFAGIRPALGATSLKFLAAFANSKPHAQSRISTTSPGSGFSYRRSTRFLRRSSVAR